MIVLNEASLYRYMKSFLAYYHESRTHLSLAKDAPEPRPVHPLELGAVVDIPQVGGLHHRYERRSLNLAILAGIAIQGQVSSSSQLDETRLVLLAHRSVDFSYFCDCSRRSVVRTSDFQPLSAGRSRPRMGFAVGTILSLLNT